MKIIPFKNDNEFWSLTPGKEYVVIGLDFESYRILDDKGEPILFPKEGFQVVDDAIPENWAWDRHSDDEYYAGPAELQLPGFYEDYFEGKPQARKKLAEFLRRAGIESNSVSTPHQLKEKL
jgi:hypothetical protein